MYRDNRIINWCSDCRTSISDLEVEHLDVDDALTYARYPLADGEGHVTIATVRPATILADVAVAVHPDDERYTHLIGKEVIVPVVGRRVPVIADERVEPEFGTGALKITPGHDPIDFEIGRDHGLPEPTVIGFDGRMTGDMPVKLIGLTEEEAARLRRRVAARTRAGSRSARATGTPSATASAPARASSRSSRCSGGARWSRVAAPRSTRSSRAASRSTRRCTTRSRSTG